VGISYSWLKAWSRKMHSKKFDYSEILSMQGLVVALAGMTAILVTVRSIDSIGAGVFAQDAASRFIADIRTVREAMRGSRNSLHVIVEPAIPGRYSTYKISDGPHILLQKAFPYGVSSFGQATLDAGGIPFRPVEFPFYKGAAKLLV